MLLKKGIFMTAAALTASCFLSLGVSAAGEMTGRVTTKTSPLTVRASASIEAQKLGSLARGSTVTLLSRTGDWWHVEYAAGKTGYCHAGYITVLENVGKRPAVSLAVPDYKQYDSRWAEVLVGGSRADDEGGSAAPPLHWPIPRATVPAAPLPRHRWKISSPTPRAARSIGRTITRAIPHLTICPSFCKISRTENLPSWVQKTPRGKRIGWW